MMKLTGLRNQKRTLDCTPSVSGRKLLFVMFVAGNTLGSLSKSRKYLGDDGAETLLRLLVGVSEFVPSRDGKWMRVQPPR